MRILALAIPLVATIAAAAPASAQTYPPPYPVCMQVAARQGGYVECSYVSMEQCRASASGRAAYCLPNPYLPLRPRARWR